MKEGSFYIPQYLDEPERFLLWTIDEAIIFFLPLLTGMYFSYAAIGLGLGAASLIGLKKFKTKMGFESFKAWVYWHLPLTFWLASTPASAIREYVG